MTARPIQAVSIGEMLSGEAGGPGSFTHVENEVLHAILEACLGDLERM
jgi:hypothetical protein